MRLKADLLLFMVAVIWGSAFVAQRLAGRHNIAYLFNGTSFLLAGLILIPFIPKKTKPTAEQWRWMLIAGCILFVATALQQVGIIYTRIANASFLTSLYVVFTPFLLWIFFREKPHLLDAIGVGMACVGAFMLSTAGRIRVQPGDALELIGSLFWALHFVVLGKFASKYESISFASGHFIVTGLINLVIGLFVEDAAKLIIPELTLAILYRASLSIGIGYTLQVWGQKHTPPTDAALILGLEAVFAVIAGWLVLNESLVPIQIVGCLLIFFAAILSQFKMWTSGKIDPQHLVEGR